MSGNTISPSECPRSKDYSISLPEIFTHDGCQLETVEVSPVVNKSSNANKKYMINFHGRDQRAMSGIPHNISQVINMAKELNCTMIGFSYRGIGLSTGSASSEDDVVTDGIAQVQRLLDGDVLPKDITLCGHSVGGAVATLVAKYFYRHGIEIKVINDRSFSSLTNGTVGVIQSEAFQGRPEVYSQPQFSDYLILVLVWLTKPLIKLGLLLTKWEMAAADAYEVLPEKNKLCFVVKGKKIAGEFLNQAKQLSEELHLKWDSEREYAVQEPKRDQDEVLPHWCSLYSAVKPWNKRDEKMQTLKKISSHNGFHGEFDGERRHRAKLGFFKTRDDQEVMDVMKEFIHQSGQVAQIY